MTNIRRRSQQHGLPNLPPQMVFKKTKNRKSPKGKKYD